MSWLSKWLGGEDPISQCGWKWAHIYAKPQDDPYYDACVWHDEATSEGSWAQANMTPKQIQEEFVRLMDSIDATTGRDPNNLLKQFYTAMTHEFAGLFEESPK